MKKLLLSLAILLGVLIVAAGAAFWQISRHGSSSMERWIGAEIQDAVNSRLKPQVSFTDLDYQYPYTVHLKNLKLTADDPQQVNQTIDILSVDDATITLSKIPREGEPIVIKTIVLNQPLLQAIAISPDDGHLVGFSDLLKEQEKQDVKQATTQEAKTKLSDVLQMREVQLNDGKIVYDPRIPDTEPMQLDHINTQLHIVPKSDGNYALAVNLDRQPVFSLALSMQLNLDTLMASDAQLDLHAAVGRDKDNYLPPQVQQFLKAHQVQGDLTASIRGALPITDPRNGRLDMTLSLANGFMTAGDYKIPVDQLTGIAQLQAGKLVLPAVTIDALKGKPELSGWVTLNPQLDSVLTLKVTDVIIDDLFVTPGTAEHPKLAGRVKANINLTAPLAQVADKLTPPTSQPVTASTEASPPLPAKWGNGEIHLDHGRLVKIPVLDNISGAITKSASLFSRHRGAKPTEKADLTFDLSRDQVKIDDFNFAGEIVAARGDGTIGLDKHLDLMVNGGPIEKLQSLMGKTIGGAIGAITDDLIAYKVTGTIEDPKIDLVVVGGNITGTAGKAVNGVATGVKDVGKGVGDVVKDVTGQ